MTEQTTTRSRVAQRIEQARPLDGLVALVTGGSSGIGRAVAEGMAAAGAAVAVNYHSGQDAAREVVEGIEAAGGRAVALGGDVSDEDAVRDLVAQTVDRLGDLDVVVANAGLQKDAAFVDLTLEDWQRVIDVNLTGQFLVCREAARHFTRRGVPAGRRSAGVVLCMSSVHDVIPWAGHANYATSKGGIRLLMETMAQELASARVRVNALAPGAIRTPINTDAWDDEESLRELLRLIPYGRIGEPEDVAAAAVWLCSDAADYVTGTTLYVDGGMTLYPGFRDNG